MKSASRYEELSIVGLQDFLVDHGLSIRIVVDRDRAQARLYRGRSTVAMGDGIGITRAIRSAIDDYKCEMKATAR